MTQQMFQVVKMSPTHSYHWNVTITLPPLKAILGCSLMYLSCHHNCQHILFSGYLWPTAECQHKCFCSSQRTRSRNFYSWMKPKHFLLFLGNAVSPAWFATNWTQRLVWEHCGMLTLLVQVPVQPQHQEEKQFPTQKSQLTSAFPTLKHTDSFLIRN